MHGARIADLARKGLRALTNNVRARLTLFRIVQHAKKAMRSVFHRIQVFFGEDSTNVLKLLKYIVIKHHRILAIATLE